MSKIKEVVYLYDSNGNVTIYKDKIEAASILGYSFINYSVAEFLISEDKINKKYNGRTPFYIANKYGNFILRNEYGDILTGKDFNIEFDEIRKNQNNKKSKWDRYAFWDGKSPVPGTGKKVYGKYFRRPKTLRTLKYLTGIYDELEPKGKIRGGKTNVPTSWDDVPLHRDRCWKNFRNTQYKKQP